MFCLISKSQTYISICYLNSSFATLFRSTTDGLEQIVFVTPVSQGTEDKFTIRLAGGVPENSTLLMFSYRPDPVVTFVRPRNINVE